MQDLFAAAHENVQLAILDGTQAVYIEQVTAEAPSTAVASPAGRLPLHATGVGKVLLGIRLGRPSGRCAGERADPYTQRTRSSCLDTCDER